MIWLLYIALCIAAIIVGIAIWIKVALWITGLGVTDDNKIDWPW